MIAPPPEMIVQHQPAEWRCTLVGPDQGFFKVSGRFGSFRHTNLGDEAVAVPVVTSTNPGGRLAGVISGTFWNRGGGLGEYRLVAIKDLQHGQQITEFYLKPYGNAASGRMTVRRFDKGPAAEELLGSGTCSWNQGNAIGEAP